MSGSRDRELESIRATYAAYGRTRAGLWNLSNPGFARIVTERDDAIVSLILDSSLRGHPPRILDVGCGAADLAVRAYERGAQGTWTGIDLLQPEIDVARRRAPWGTWDVASADDLPFLDRSFDVAVASTLFSSLPSGSLSHDVAREIGRVLRPGGWLVWYDLRYDSPTNPAVHGINRRALEKLFPAWIIQVRSMTLLPPLARRLGPATGWLYPLLHSIPVLRSHLIGRLQSHG